MEKYSLKEMLLYKIDRTVAIAGVVIIGCYGIYVNSVEIALSALGILAVYLGVKGK